MTPVRFLLLTCLACLVALLNAAKPLVVDDWVYHAFAAHLAERGVGALADPYGFTFAGDNRGMDTLMPPVVPAWWAVCIRLVGNEPGLCKLGLFPFALVQVVALDCLLRRFAPRWAWPVLLLTVLSPVELPCWNFMLDLPALALGLGGLTLYLTASERRRPELALLAGLVTGLALQTKYTTFTIPAAVAVHALLFRRWREGLLTCLVAGVLFVGWEAWVARQCGSSHFLYHLERKSGPVLLKARLVLPLVTTLGATCPCLGLLALVGGRVRARWIVAAGALAALSYLLVALVPASGQVLLRSEGGASRLDLPGLVFGLNGVLVVLAGGWALARGKTPLTPQPPLPPEAGREGEPERAALAPPLPFSGRGGRGVRGASSRVDAFLLLWLLIEVAGYFILTPFPAARRVLGLTVVAALLLARLLPRTRLVWCIAASGVLLGLGFFTLDSFEAAQERQAVRRASAWVRELDPQAEVWVAGNSTFHFYGERAGLRRVLPGSCPGPGAWYVADVRIAPALPAPFAEARPVVRFTYREGPPLSSLYSFHGSGTPLVADQGPRCVAVFRLPEAPPGIMSARDVSPPCPRRHRPCRDASPGGSCCWGSR